MVTEMVKLTSKGQFTMPVAIRRNLGLEKGNRLLVEQVEDYVVIRKARDSFEELTEVFSQAAKKKGITREDLEKTLKQVRREVYEEMYGE